MTSEKFINDCKKIISNESVTHIESVVNVWFCKTLMFYKGLFYNLHNGDGSGAGNYVFCDEDGLTPEEAAEKYNCIYHETDSYFNIGGF